MARPASQPDIGPALIQARAAKVPWKVLAKKHGLCITRLWMLWRAARDAADAPWPSDIENIHE